MAGWFEVVSVDIMGGAAGRRMEGDGSRPLTRRDGRARVRVCMMYYFRENRLAVSM